MKTGLGQDAWKCEGWSHYQTSTGADSLKFTLETEDRVPRAEHIDREWLRRNVPAFIGAEDWPSGSPDLNPVDCFGGRGLPKVPQQRGQSEDIRRESSGRDPPLETVRAAIAE